ncbi:MAG: hypothetical protein IT382_11220 [Deltaproteobacteria bacterium]|nr:hypothetical protein [Deltaproteobacteria bacterium]
MATRSVSSLGAVSVVLAFVVTPSCTEAIYPSGDTRDAIRRAAVEDQLSTLGDTGALPMHGTFEIAEECAPEAPLEIDLGAGETLVWSLPMALIRGFVDWAPAGLADLASAPGLEQSPASALDVLTRGSAPMLADGSPAFSTPSTGFLLVEMVEAVPSERPQIECGSRTFAGGWVVSNFFDDDRYLKYHTQAEVARILEAQYGEYGPPRTQPWENALMRQGE